MKGQAWRQQPWQAPTTQYAALGSRRARGAPHAWHRSPQRLCSQSSVFGPGALWSSAHGCGSFLAIAPLWGRGPNEAWRSPVAWLAFSWGKPRALGRGARSLEERDTQSLGASPAIPRATSVFSWGTQRPGWVKRPTGAGVPAPQQERTTRSPGLPLQQLLGAPGGLADRGGGMHRVLQLQLQPPSFHFHPLGRKHTRQAGGGPS